MEATESSPLLGIGRSRSSSFLETKSGRPASSSLSCKNGNDGSETPSRVTPLVRLGYALGHAQNDLCGAMYFSYLLVYLEGTGLSPVDAGTVLIVGQVVDGCATPLVGLFSDRWSCFRRGCCWGLAGRRKSWYIGGMVLVTLTFWMLFTPFPSSTGTSAGTAFLDSLSPVVYYAVANSLFQIGWASVQVSHMSMVPEITPIMSERCFLNSMRYAVTVATSITVYVLVYLFCAADTDTGNPAVTYNTTTHDDQTTLAATDNPEDTGLLWTLQAISYIVLLAGALMGLAFIALVNETNENDNPKTKDAPPSTNGDTDGNGTTAANGSSNAPKTLYDWFQTPGFFGVTANYAFSRLCVNTVQLYLPFYVLHTMPAHPSAVATVPLMAYVGMILSSIAAPRASALVADAAWLCAGATAILSVGSAALLLLADPRRHAWAVFVSSGILGFGCAQLMVTSQTQVCELVGCDRNGGVVFGISSLCDKLSTGAVIFLIQRLVQGATADGRGAGAMDELGMIYRFTAAGGPLVCALLASVSLLTVPTSIRGRDRQDHEKECAI